MKSQGKTWEQVVASQSTELWILTAEFNDYDQHGAYFVRAFIGKPLSIDVEKAITGYHSTCSGDLLDWVMAGGGRQDTEHVWFNLEKQ